MFYKMFLKMFLILILILFLNLKLQNSENYQNQETNIFNAADDYCMCKKRPTVEEDKIGTVNINRERSRVENNRRSILNQDIQEETGTLFSEELEEDSIPVIPQRQNISGDIEEENNLGLRASEKNSVVKDLEKRFKNRKGPIHIHYHCNKNKNNNSDSNSDSNNNISNDINIAPQTNPNTIKQHKNCISLLQAGFNPSWTKDVVMKLKSTQKGSEQLNYIYKKFKTISNMNILTDKMISDCFPNYLNNRENQENEINNNQSLEQNNNTNNINNINNFRKQINNDNKEVDLIIDDEPPSDISLNNNISPILFMTNQNDEYVPTYELEVSEEYVENEEENNLENFQKKIEKNEKGTFTTINKTTDLSNKHKNKKVSKCNLSNLRIEINSAIQRHYVSLVNKMEKDNTLPIGLNKTQVMEGYRKNFDYMTDKAMLEINNMIRNFKDKKFNIWKEEIQRFRLRFYNGLPLPGSDFSIPWHLIDKYEVCFANIENNRRYPVDRSL